MAKNVTTGTEPSRTGLIAPPHVRFMRCRPRKRSDWRAHHAAVALTENTFSPAGSGLCRMHKSITETAPPARPRPAARGETGPPALLHPPRHIANARLLASRAAQRTQWVAERQAALNQVYQRVTSAGGSGLAINGTQVVARRSLAELGEAFNAVRGNVAAPAVMARRERDFRAVVNAHSAEFESSPG